MDDAAFTSLFRLSWRDNSPVSPSPPSEFTDLELDFAGPLWLLHCKKCKQPKLLVLFRKDLRGHPGGNEDDLADILKPIAELTANVKVVQVFAKPVDPAEDTASQPVKIQSAAIGPNGKSLNAEGELWLRLKEEVRGAPQQCQCTDELGDKR
jgi:hypothetical protein